MSSTDLLARAAARVGTSVRGKWTLLELLGTGGMACVYRARHRTGLEVALKIAHPELSRRLDARGWLLREAIITNSMDHPCVTRVLDDDHDDDGAPLLVMDLLRGESLSDHVRRLGGRLPAGRVFDVAEQALEVLAVVHDRGIVHCDIKPDNLYLTEERMMLLDFGIARADAGSVPPLPREIAAEPMGTPDFMPPEQAAGRWEWVDGRTDLHALGATLFLIASGRFVRDGISVKDTLAAARSLRAPSLGLVCPGLRSALTDVVDRALSFDPDARPPSARAMLAEVRRARERYIKAPSDELLSASRRKYESGAYPSAGSMLPTSHGRRTARAS